MSAQVVLPDVVEGLNVHLRSVDVNDVICTSTALYCPFDLISLSSTTNIEIISSKDNYNGHRQRFVSSQQRHDAAHLFGQASEVQGQVLKLIVFTVQNHRLRTFAARSTTYLYFG